MLKQLLQTFEPDVFTDERLEDSRFTRVFMSELVVIGVNVCLQDKLPCVRSELRYTNVLEEYSKVRCEDMGRRLKDFIIENPESYEVFSILEGGEVACRFAPENSTERSKRLIPVMASAFDWQFHNNFCLDQCSLKSAVEVITIPVADRFRKAGVPLPAKPTMEWCIDASRWPASMKLSVASVPARIEASESKAPPAKKPRGSGKAKARV